MGWDLQKTNPVRLRRAHLSASHPSHKKEREVWGSLFRCDIRENQKPGVNEYPSETPNRVARGELNS
jgi:hypothetical protein